MYIDERRQIRRYDYVNIRCPSTLVKAPFVFAIVSHDNSTLTTNGHVHPTPARCLWVNRCIGMKWLLKLRYSVQCGGCPYYPPRPNYRPDSCPSGDCDCPSIVCLFACIYTLSPTSGLCILSCFLALLIVNGRVDVQTAVLESDVALGLITCDMRLVSTYICLMS